MGLLFVNGNFSVTSYKKKPCSSNQNFHKRSETTVESFRGHRRASSDLEDPEIASEKTQAFLDNSVEKLFSGASL